MYRLRPVRARRASVFLTILIALLFHPIFVSGAAAQPEDRVGPFAADIHGVYARYGENAGIAELRGLPSDALPPTGLGFKAGGHWYPFKIGVVTIGIGADLTVTRGTSKVDTTVTPALPAVVQKFRIISPQFSLNFGGREGWSYISGGAGISRFAKLSVVRDGVPDETGGNLRALNYGGGARWFTSPHVAFSFDVRFYALSPSPANEDYSGNPRTTWLVVTAGISIK